MNRQLFIGFDPREAACFAVARSSALRRATAPLPIHGLVLSDLQAKRLYARPIEWHQRRDFDRYLLTESMHDVVSNAPMSTEFACSRFLVPHLAGSGLAAFVDCDVMFRCNPAELFEQHVKGKAVTVVKHDFRPTNKSKMGGQAQTSYNRKCWSSVMIFDCDHPSNKRLTLDLVNTRRGIDLHNFCWLEDDEIGEMRAEYNYLVGITQLPATSEPQIVHWTEGAPCLPGYANVPYANEFWRELGDWAK